MGNKVVEPSEGTVTQVSDETKLRMVEFFMKTSVPRILAAKQAEKREEVETK